MSTLPYSADTASGKGARDENFPVGSWLLPRHVRPHVATFYAFARTADDIADSPHLEAQEKITRLDRLEVALTGASTSQEEPDVAVRLRHSLAATGVTNLHARHLLAAFRQDARKNRYADWDDLMGYCQLSAAPVGRYMLDLHGEGTPPRPHTDSLCNALQILNHIQDCAADMATLDRVYIPRVWMEEDSANIEDVMADALNPNLRAVLSRMLRGVEDLLKHAAPAPDMIGHRRLAAETATILKLAWRLTQRLHRGDPLASRVKLGRVDFIRAIAGGIGHVLARPMTRRKHRW